MQFRTVVMWRENRDTRGRTGGMTKYEGWNFNSGNYLFTTDTK